MNLADILIYSGTTELNLILWSFYAAIVIATLVTYFTRTVFGKFVRTLLEKEAESPETALSPDETGIKITPFIKMGLKNHLHYKDMLVAITEDGRYYANLSYTDEPPILRELVAITRKKRSRIVEKTEETEDQVEETDVIPTENEATELPHPERVKFDVTAAKYYIPKEVKPKVRSIYKEGSMNLLWVIAGLVGLALITAFGAFIVEGLVDMVSNLANK